MKHGIGYGALLAAMLAAACLSACKPERRSQQPAANEEQAPAATQQEAATAKVQEIDIGDVTYGVYTTLEFLNVNIRPNIRVERLASQRFDYRTQKLTLTITPPHPKELPIVMMTGSTRQLMNHTVYLLVHVYREYSEDPDGSGEKTRDEVVTHTQIFGDQRGTLTPYRTSFDGFEGLETGAKSFLFTAELEVWLFLNTNVDTFDPETADFDSVPHARYMGFNPLRVNLNERKD